MSAARPSTSQEDRRRDGRRLGNLTPLEYAINKTLGSADYERKREAYAQSRYRLTRNVVQTVWTPAAIRARQLEMAATAVRIWRIEDDGQ